MLVLLQPEHVESSLGRSDKLEVGRTRQTWKLRDGKQLHATVSRDRACPLLKGTLDSRVLAQQL